MMKEIMLRVVRALGMPGLTLFVAAVTSAARQAATYAQEPATPLAQGQQQPEVTVDPDGTIHLPAFTIPMSSFLSSEARAAFMDGMVAHPPPLPSGPLDAPGVAQKWRADFDKQYFAPKVDTARRLYPVKIEALKIAQVPVDVITPMDGIAPKNKDRVLINLHGGAFVIGAGLGGQLESIPVAATGRIKVVTVDYRQGPEYKFPAASKDVAAVYKALLKHYQPQHIGIYGCSAGGMLAAQAVAWFQAHDLPRPGAIGIFCASATGIDKGDSAYMAWALNGRMPPLPGQRGLTLDHYLGNGNPQDPLFAPVYAPASLGKFPPTLLITGTRAMELSSAVYTHNQLVKLGVDAELHVWEGGWHAFFYDVEIPESKEVFGVIVNFFDRHLGPRRP